MRSMRSSFVLASGEARNAEGASRTFAFLSGFVDTFWDVDGGFRWLARRFRGGWPLSPIVGGRGIGTSVKGVSRASVEELFRFGIFVEMGRIGAVIFLE